MDETDYIDMSGFYTDPWAGSYDTSMSNLDPGLFDTNSLYGDLGGFDFSSMFGDPTGGMDYSSLFGVTPDYTSMFPDTPVTDTASISYDPTYSFDQTWNQGSMMNSPLGNQWADIVSGSTGTADTPGFGVEGLGGSPGLGVSGVTDIVSQLMNSPDANVLGDSSMMPTGTEMDPLRFSLLNTANGVDAGGVDSGSMPSVVTNPDGTRQVVGTDGLVQGTWDSTGVFRPGATDLANANAQAAQVAAQSKGTPSGGGSGGGAPQPKQEQKTATQSALGQAALIAQLLAALGAKGVKPPKPDAANNRSANAMSWKRFADGGQVLGAERQAQGALGLLRGGTSGQSDQVPAKVSHGEYVMDADVVAALGDGNTEAGAAKLDEMRHNIRKHKRSAPANKIPPQAKSPLAYMKGQK